MEGRRGGDKSPKDDENNVTEKSDKSVNKSEEVTEEFMEGDGRQNRLIDFKAGFDVTSENNEMNRGVPQGSSEGVLAFMERQEVGKVFYGDDVLL